MKANPGGIVAGEAIIGRETEINGIWDKLEKRSVILAAERRVGKTSTMRKMRDHPKNGWLPMICWVEQCKHPIDCVEIIYKEAEKIEAQSDRGRWLNRIRRGYQAITGTEIAGWKMPQVKTEWKRLLTNLVEDVAEHTANRMLVMLDEFPLMISSIAESDPKSAMELLDTFRALRQEYEPSGKIRFIFSGSIGFHIILETLRAKHAYKSNPVTGMATVVLAGMSQKDVELMCTKYLDEENICRHDSSTFATRMYELTDGLPLYIQHVCEGFQEAKLSEVSPDNIDAAVREMLDNRTVVEGFSYAAKRIDSYYNVIGLDDLAKHILRVLCNKTDYANEESIVEYVRTQMVVEKDDSVLAALELLSDDNYIVRDTSTGERRYRFRYNIMRRWWRINKG